MVAALVVAFDCLRFINTIGGGWGFVPFHKNPAGFSDDDKTESGQLAGLFLPAPDVKRPQEHTQDGYGTDVGVPCRNWPCLLGTC